MESVTGRIKKYKQPYGGFVPAKKFKKEILSKDGIELNKDENIHGITIGLAVDYLVRILLGADFRDAFSISLKGASFIDRYNNIDSELPGSHLMQAFNLLNGMQEMDDDITIINACQLVGFDVGFRGNPLLFKDVSHNIPDKDTIENIRILARRVESYFLEHGPITKDGFTFEGEDGSRGGYTDIVSSGDGDFLTKNTLWDLKVLRSNITKNHTLQLLMYYLMGQKSKYDEFQNITKIGIINPRLNIVYILDIDEISDDTLDIVKYDVIGFDKL